MSIFKFYKEIILVSICVIVLSFIVGTVITANITPDEPVLDDGTYKIATGKDGRAKIIPVDNEDDFHVHKDGISFTASFN